VDIVVCVKHVPDAETRLRTASSGRWFDPDGVKFTVANTYDEAAAEEALRLKEKCGAKSVRVVSLGPARAEEGLRHVLSMGADEATLIETPADFLPDPLTTARFLAAVIQSIPHDLVMVGKQAADDEAGVVGSALGAYLALPSYAFVTELTPDLAGRMLALRRYVEGGEEVLKAPFPAVVSLQKGAADPRTPTLPNILKARKKPLTKVPLAEAQSRAQALPGGPASGSVKSFVLPPPRTGAKMVEFQTPEEAADKLLKLLREEAKVL
jgi:electron transfer flavoprotein beta subunit